MSIAVVKRPSWTLSSSVSYCCPSFFLSCLPLAPLPLHRALSNHYLPAGPCSSFSCSLPPLTRSRRTSAVADRFFPAQVLLLRAYCVDAGPREHQSMLFHGASVNAIPREHHSMLFPCARPPPSLPPRPRFCSRARSRDVLKHTHTSKHALPWS